MVKNHRIHGRWKLSDGELQEALDENVYRQLHKMVLGRKQQAR